MVLRAGEVVASALSINVIALLSVLGGSECITVLNTLPTVKCICSQMSFEAGLQLVVGISLIPKSAHSF